MAIVKDLVDKNIDFLMKIRKLKISTELLSDYYSIYLIYKGLPNNKGKMERYYATADLAKTSEKTVIRAVKMIEKII